MLIVNLDWNFTTGDQWLVKTQGTEKQGYNWNKKCKKQEKRANNCISNVLEHSYKRNDSKKYI